jgi:hypothetical protein
VGARIAEKESTPSPMYLATKPSKRRTASATQAVAGSQGSGGIFFRHRRNPLVQPDFREFSLRRIIRAGKPLISLHLQRICATASSL